MEKHVRILGILYIVYHALGLAVGLSVLGLLSGIGVLSGDIRAAGVLTLIGSFIVALVVVFSAPGIRTATRVSSIPLILTLR